MWRGNEKGVRMASLRTMVAFDLTINPGTFARSCRDWGINLPILGPAFFADDAMGEALVAEGLGVWLNLPVFYDEEYLAAHPDRYAITSRGRRAVADWLHFACPSREETIEHVVAVLHRALAHVRPDVVSLDFIRYFVFWERVDLDGPGDAIEDGCYCPACLAAFERHSGQRVSRDDPAADIRRHLLTEWGDWKTRRIAEVAERLFDEIRRAAPGAMLGIKIVPWLESDLGGAIRHCVGQDFARLARNVDIVAPMAFTHILRRTPEWKARLLARVQQVTGKPVLSYVQAGAVYRPEPITAAEFSDELVTAVEGDHAGLAIFHYEQLVADPEKARILRTALLS